MELFPLCTMQFLYSGTTSCFYCKPMNVSPPILLKSHPSPSLIQTLSSPHHSSRPFKRLNISICFQYWLSDLTSQSSVIFMQTYISKNYTWLNSFTIHTICVSFSNNIKFTNDVYPFPNPHLLFLPTIYSNHNLF